jgi:hypothetical protein
MVASLNIAWRLSTQSGSKTMRLQDFDDRPAARQDHFDVGGRKRGAQRRDALREAAVGTVEFVALMDASNPHLHMHLSVRVVRRFRRLTLSAAGNFKPTPLWTSLVISVVMKRMLNPDHHINAARPPPILARRSPFARIMPS